MEELKMILETVKNVGEAAKWLVIIYYAKNFLIQVIWACFTLLVVRYVFGVANNAIKTHAFGSQVCQILGYGYIPLKSYDKQKLLDRINNAIKGFEKKE